MATLPPPHLIRRPAPMRWVAPAGAVALAAIVVALVFSMPDAMLERWLWTSGAASLLSGDASQPGIIERSGAAVMLALVVGSLGWAVLYLALEPGGLVMPRRSGVNGVPVVRRADAHPDAPPRRPLGAAELGVPMPPKRERAPAAPSPAPVEPTSLAALVERLEQGITRRDGERIAG